MPKGHIEKNETTIEAALRETYEETGISDICFPWGLIPIKFDNITLYIGKTTQEPKIRKNPKTGLYEHECAVWFLWDDLINHVYDYLKLAIINIGLLIHEL